MDSRVCQPRALDLHQLQAPFRHTRVQRPAQIRRLMQSIDADGQRVPLAAVTGSEQFILVDGYSRWEALQRLGRDTAVVEVWHEPLAGALIQVLARHQGRSFEPIEQAWMLSAAVAEGASQHELAHALGKDPSWVNRRLALLSQLGEPLQEAVRSGTLSSWAASRILVPLARANTTDAETLLASLQREPLSTRELNTWYQHYLQANRTVRARLLAQPRLFIQAKESANLPKGTDPEAQFHARLAQIRRELQTLTHSLPALLDPSPDAATLAALREAVSKTTKAFSEMADAFRAATPEHSHTPRKGSGRATDQPPARAQSRDCTPGAGPGCPASGAPRGPDSDAIATAHLATARALLQGPGECGASAGATA
jgi:ParB-like chromosome segregation protein Spo0J